MASYIYPKLPANFNLIIRFFGAGLGNCLFVYGRALILSKKYGLEIIRPNWEQFKLGPILRSETDKRFYRNIFNSSDIKGFKKLWILLLKNKIDEEQYNGNTDSGVVIVKGLKDYFVSLYGYNDYIRHRILTTMNRDLFFKYKKLKSQVKNKIAIHIRRGDFNSDMRTSDSWYYNVIKTLKTIDHTIEFVLFSDASPDELNNIITLSNIRYLNTSDALVDLLLLSESKLIIGSDSTFSGWGSYLGENPIILEKRHFPPIHPKKNIEYVSNQPNKSILEQMLLS